MKQEALSFKRKELLAKLHKFSEFYLVGGTALALQMGHRTSVDFDLFSNREMNSAALIAKARRVFRGHNIAIRLRHSEQTNILVDDVKIDFVCYRFPLILKPLEFQKLRIAQAKEIALMKAFALNFRGTTKDYIDLYFILKEKVATLKDIEKLGDKKYGNEFNFRLFLNQLLILEGLKDAEIAFFRKEPNKEEIRKFFEQEIKKIKI